MKAFFILLLQVFAINCFANYILVNKDVNGAAYIFSANPGDTFAFRASLNPWNNVYIAASGSSTNPIVLINDGGQVQFTSGFEIEYCNYFKLTGTGSSDFYGFVIRNNATSGTAISIHGKCSFFSIDHIQIAKKLYAFWIKNEVSCDTTLNYPNHPLHDFEVSNIKVDTVNQDGFYFGSTAPTGGRNITCNGTTYTNRIAGRLYNVYIHNIIMNRVGRTGIQLSGCDSGTNRISNCTVKNCGFEFNASQGAGIWLGGMTSNCEVDNNTVDSTWLHNYISYGIRTCYFHDNYGNHAGELYGDSSGVVGNHRNNGYSSALVNDPPTVPTTNSTFRWEHNSLNQNTEPTGVKVAVLQWNNTYNSDNIICDCGSPIYVASGITYSTTCLTACPGIYDTANNNTAANAVSIPLNTNVNGTISSSTDIDWYKFNVTTAGTITVTLTNLPANYNIYLYNSSGTLLGSSTNSGTTNESISYSASTGLYGVKVSAPSGVFNTTSCYQLLVSTGSFLKADYSGTKNDLMLSNNIKLYPNPAHSAINLYFKSVAEGYHIEIFNTQGKLVADKLLTGSSMQIDLRNFNSGIYLVKVINKEGVKIYDEKFLKE